MSTFVSQTGVLNIQPLLLAKQGIRAVFGLYGWYKQRGRHPTAIPAVCYELWKKTQVWMHQFLLLPSLHRQLHSVRAVTVSACCLVQILTGESQDGFTSSWPILCQGHLSASRSCSSGIMYLLEEFPVILAWVHCLQLLGNGMFTAGLLLLWAGSISSSMVKMTSNSSKRRSECDEISSANLVWTWLVYKLCKKIH